jgi:5'-phosphate synthase pdxT subunit
MMKTVGVLAYHGDVVEHIQATEQASKNLNFPVTVIPVRTKDDIKRIQALIIPGGESTTLHKLSKREGIWGEIKTVKNIFGTCAGAIMLAKKVRHKTADQETLELMDIEVDRNAYGRQTESFGKGINSKLGKLQAVFIRAPKIITIGKNVTVLSKDEGQIIACDQVISGGYYLATCFHPELTSPLFHEYFLKRIFTL